MCRNLTKISFSKMVNKSAGEVVGASQAGKENIEALETIDFTKMSYTQAKKIEMDTQVRTYFLRFYFTLCQGK